MEIKNKLTVPRGEVGGDNGRERGKGFQEHLYRTHGQNEQGVGSGVRGGGGWGGESCGGKMDIIVLEQQ